MRSSISPSSSESISFCQICWQSAHGNHFGAFTCRACAAFFRRAVLGHFVKLKCRAGNGTCQPSEDGRFGCKKCRTDRCLEAGMNPEKLQHDRDLISSTQNIRKRKLISTTIPNSMQCFLGRPIFLLACEPELAGVTKKVINVKFLIDHAYDFFAQNKSFNNQSGMNHLEKLGYALIESRKPTLTQPVMFKRIGMEESLFFWEEEFMVVARWLTNIDLFQTFPTSLKLEILKAVWMIFARLEKFAVAVNRRKIDRNVCSMTRDCLVDISTLELDVSWFTNYKLEQLSYFIEPADQFFVDYLIDPLTEFAPSTQEITYMLTFICLRHACRKVDGIQNQMDQILETLAADLHSYYINDLKLINYAGRMAKMMQICRIFERDNMDRIERAEIAQLFDIFCVQFSHPDVFCGLQ